MAAIDIQSQPLRASSSFTLIALLPISLLILIVSAVRRARLTRGWDVAPHKGAIYAILCVNAILVASGVFGVVASGDGVSVGLRVAQRVIEIFGRVLASLIILYLLRPNTSLNFAGHPPTGPLTSFLPHIMSTVTIIPSPAAATSLAILIFLVVVLAVASLIELASIGSLFYHDSYLPLIFAPLLQLIASLAPIPFLFHWSFRRIATPTTESEEETGLLARLVTVTIVQILSAFQYVLYVIASSQSDAAQRTDASWELSRAICLLLWITGLTVLIFQLYIPNSYVGYGSSTSQHGAYDQQPASFITAPSASTSASAFYKPSNIQDPFPPAPSPRDYTSATNRSNRASTSYYNNNVIPRPPNPTPIKSSYNTNRIIPPSPSDDFLATLQDPFASPELLGRSSSFSQTFNTTSIVLTTPPSFSSISPSGTVPGNNKAHSLVRISESSPTAQALGLGLGLKIQKQGQAYSFGEYLRTSALGSTSPRIIARVRSDPILASAFDRRSLSIGDGSPKTKRRFTSRPLRMIGNRESRDVADTKDVDGEESDVDFLATLVQHALDSPEFLAAETRPESMMIGRVVRRGTRTTIGSMSSISASSHYGFPLRRGHRHEGSKPHPDSPFRAVFTNGPLPAFPPYQNRHSVGGELGGRLHARSNSASALHLASSFESMSPSIRVGGSRVSTPSVMSSARDGSEDGNVTRARSLNLRQFPSMGRLFEVNHSFSTAPSLRPSLVVPPNHPSSPASSTTSLGRRKGRPPTLNLSGMNHIPLSDAVPVNLDVLAEGIPSQERQSTDSFDSVQTASTHSISSLVRGNRDGIPASISLTAFGPPDDDNTPDWVTDLPSPPAPSVHHRRGGPDREVKRSSFVPSMFSHRTFLSLSSVSSPSDSVPGDSVTPMPSSPRVPVRPKGDTCIRVGHGDDSHASSFFDLESRGTSHSITPRKLIIPQSSEESGAYATVPQLSPVSPTSPFSTSTSTAPNSPYLATPRTIEFLSSTLTSPVDYQGLDRAFFPSEKKGNGSTHSSSSSTSFTYLDSVISRHPVQQIPPQLIHAPSLPPRTSASSPVKKSLSSFSRLGSPFSLSGKKKQKTQLASVKSVASIKRLGTSHSAMSDIAFELQEFGVRSPDGEDGGDIRRRGLDMDQADYRSQIVQVAGVDSDDTDRSRSGRRSAWDEWR